MSMPGQSEANAVNRYMSILRSGSTAFCLIASAVALAALIASYLLPRKYQATSTVSIEQNVVSDLVKGIAVTPSMDARLRILNVSLLSRNRLLSVASALDMDLKANTPVEQEKMVEELRSNITIAREDKKGLFFISYTDTNPVLARDFVNTIIRQYIEESTASKRRESFDATSFLSGQIETFQKRIEQAQSNVDEFKARKGMYLGVNEQLLRQQIKEIEERLEDIRIRKGECQVKLELAGSNSRLQDQLLEREIKMQSLLGSYTRRHPAVMRLREEIRAIKQAIELEKTEKPAAEADYNAEQLKLKTEMKSLGEMEANLRVKLDQNIKDLQELPSIRTELAALEQQKINETAIYQQLVARLGQSEVSKQMELQDKSITFNVIDSAVLPTRFISPKRQLIILGGMLAGLALAGACLVALDLLRGKVHSLDDARACGREVLVVLPQFASKEILRRKRLRRNVICATAVLYVGLGGVAVMEFLQVNHMERVFFLIKNII